MPKQQTYLLPCTCCCSRTQEYGPDTDYPDTHLKCPGCGCRKNIPAPTTITIRVYIQGYPTLQTLNNLQEIATLMGVDEKAHLIRESDEKHYIELPGEGITNRLEIAKLTGQKREKAKP